LLTGAAFGCLAVVAANPPGYDEWLRALGLLVADRRRALKLTQPAAAALCGFDFKFYQDVEYGARPLTTRTLYLLATGLRSSVSALIPPGPGEADFAPIEGVAEAAAATVRTGSNRRRSSRTSGK
jgi:transcriptional regulator with XRE-family HTH domain